MNQIQQVLHARIRALVEMTTAAKALGHKGTIGAIREAYLTTFLQDLLPQGVSAKSGIICDSLGRTSTQLDLIVTLDHSLPVITMHAGIALVPVDSALLAIEIKSTLNHKSLSQVEEQNRSIASLQISNDLPPGGRFIIPTMVVAMDSSISCDKVSQWITKTGNTAMCCVIGKYAIRRNQPENVVTKPIGPSMFNETIEFVADLYGGIQHLRKLRNFEPDWERYLKLRRVEPPELPQAEQDAPPER